MYNFLTTSPEIKLCVLQRGARRRSKKNSERSAIKITVIRPFLELPDLQTFFCPFSVLRIFRFLALPEIAHFRFEISGNRFSARARAENLVPKMF